MNVDSEMLCLGALGNTKAVFLETQKLISLYEIPHAVKANQGLFIVWRGYCLLFFFFLTLSPAGERNASIETIVNMLKHVLLN